MVHAQEEPLMSYGAGPRAHIHSDYHPMVRHCVRWANNVSRGKMNHRQTSTKVQFVEPGKVAPAP